MTNQPTNQPNKQTTQTIQTNKQTTQTNNTNKLSKPQMQTLGWVGIFTFFGCDGVKLRLRDIERDERGVCGAESGNTLLF